MTLPFAFKRSSAALKENRSSPVAVEERVIAEGKALEANRLMEEAHSYSEICPVEFEMYPHRACAAENEIATAEATRLCYKLNWVDF
ncbi:hypothetical protein Nepgr_022829 [Nepenthes gracilis]|uniref:Uncharacterized protein n=1 Tax=Nepenthes gracilis TaxID=150966 RepID=A0AAD3T2S8_NEPGR|nr:hypothetical protein Nepgr_022829 [Nepenthes gracilis]